MINFFDVNFSQHPLFFLRNLNETRSTWGEFPFCTQGMHRSASFRNDRNTGNFYFINNRFFFQGGVPLIAKPDIQLRLIFQFPFSGQGDHLGTPAGSA